MKKEETFLPIKTAMLAIIRRYFFLKQETCIEEFEVFARASSSIFDSINCSEVPIFL